MGLKGRQNATESDMGTGCRATLQRLHLGPWKLFARGRIAAMGQSKAQTPQGLQRGGSGLGVCHAVGSLK